MIRLRYAFATAFVGVLMNVNSGFAHSHLEGSIPSDGAVLTAAPRTLSLRFSEPIESTFWGVSLTSEAGKRFELVPRQSSAAGPAGLEVDAPIDLVPGAYTVEWHVLSKDGHKSSGSIRFRVGS